MRTAPCDRTPLWLSTLRVPRVPSQPARAGIAPLVAALVLAVSSASVASNTLQRCGAKKLAAMAAGCEQTAQAWSLWARAGDDARRDAGVERAASRLRRRWAGAERRDDGTCAERTAPGGDAARRLQDAVAALVDAAFGSGLGSESERRERRCAAKLLRLAGETCRAALRLERTHLRTGGTDVRHRGLARVARRFTTRWTRHAKPPCPATLDASAVLATLEQVRADAAGDATVATLRELAPLTGRLLGSAAEVEHLDPDPTYQQTLVREFDSLTPQSALKWGVIHPEPERWDFDPADRMVALAEANGMRLRGHTLVWGGAADPPNPAWVDALTDPAELRAVVRDHVTTVVRRYAGHIPLWDVVNEPLRTFGDTGDTDGLHDNHFLRVLGPGYIADALATARAADPAARLFINENFVLEPGPKQDRLARLVEELQAAGAPLDGIAFQGHVNFLPGLNRPTRDQVEAALRRFAAFGLDVEISELNVHLWGVEGDEVTRLGIQRRFYRDVVAACMAVDACRATTLWLFTDRYPTSIEQALGQDGMPLVFDDDYRPKPAYFGVRAGLLTAR
jgi:endo-1,4-beta-xylanase